MRYTPNRCISNNNYSSGGVPQGSVEYLNIKRAQVQFLAKFSYTWEIVAYTWAHLVYEGLTLNPPESA